MARIGYILLNLIPIVVMILLIPLIRNDYVLSLVYAVIIGLILWRTYERHDETALIVGLIGMFIIESFFISTGVETFNRNSLMGIMPIWLPILWAYGFVTIKRIVKEIT